MYFEGRELKSYGEFVKASELVIGRVYFRVSFLDEDMAIPEVVPLVFIGRDLSPEEPGLYYQDAGSFFEGRRWDDTNDEPAAESVDENADVDGLQNGWFEVESDGTYSMSTSSRRRATASRPVP
jgi:hypothetical protein